jgi:hypothetical protein
MLLAFPDQAKHETNEKGKRGLKWAVVGEAGSEDDEDVEEETGHGETEDDPCDQIVDGKEVFRKGTTEEEKRGLEHERQNFHDEVEMPGGDSIDLALSIPTAINKGSMHVDLGVAVDPLLAEHGDEGREEGSGQTREEDGLDADEVGIGASPRGVRIGLGWDFQTLGAGHNPKNVVTQLVVIRLELGLNGGDETSCNCGEQTSLWSEGTQLKIATGTGGQREETDEDQGDVQISSVFLDKVTVVLISLAFKFVVEFCPWVVTRSSEAGEESWQCLEHCALQTENGKPDEQRG